MIKLPIVKITLIDEKAVMPSRAHDTDSGWDLTLIGIHKIKNDTVFFKTGLQVQPPKGFYFEVFPRSSISELPLMLANSAGIIDEGYRGEIIVPIRILHPAIGSGVAENIQYPGGLLKLFDSKPISISEAAKQILAKKPKIAQMILRKRYDFEIQDVSQVDQTDRADGGFGSTGWFDIN